MRLDKLLSDMNIGTRKEIKTLVRKGEVLVDGVTVKDPGAAVSGNEVIICRGKQVTYSRHEYYMMNKPAGVISASEDPKQETVLDLMPDDRRKDLFPVGRLDKDTVGLLLISNDGDLAHRLLSPKSHVDKVYFARVDGQVTQEDVRLFKEGLLVDESLTALPAELEIRSSTAGQSEVLITIREGKFHQIKRMFQAVGKEVTYLKRLSMGPLVLDPDLEEGACRPLTEAELAALKEC